MFPILALSLSGSGIWSMLMTAIAGIAVGYLVIKKDTKIEQRRTDAIATATLCEKLGMVELADAFRQYAVGNYSGLIGDLKSVAKIAANPEKVMELMSKNFFAQLPNRLQNQEEKARILKAVNAADKADKVKTVIEESK